MGVAHLVKELDSARRGGDRVARRAKPLVAFCLPSLGHGGPDKVCLTLLETLDRRAMRLALVLGSRNNTRLARVPPDVVILGLDGHERKYPLFETALTLRRLQADVVLATLRMIPTVLAAKPMLPRKTAIVARPANHPDEARAELVQQSLLKHRLAFGAEHRLLSLADGIVVQSSGQERAYARLHRPERPVRRIANPAPGLREDAPDLPPGVARGSPTLVSVGRLTRQKGLDLLLDAFAGISFEWPEARLWLLGDGPDRGVLERHAHRIGLRHNVEFLGFVPDPSPFVVAADLYVMSSRYEGLSNALLEAQALGVPAVAATGAASGEDIVIDGVTGILCQPAAPSLEEAVRRALRCREFDREEIARRTRDRFSAEAISTQYADFLLEVAAKRRP